MDKATVWAGLRAYLLIVTVGIYSVDSHMIDEIPTSDDESENEIKSIAAICSLLSHNRRVAMIDALHTEEVKSITQIIDDLATDSDHEQRIRVSLYHNHLPRLITGIFL